MRSAHYLIIIFSISSLSANSDIRKAFIEANFQSIPNEYSNTQGIERLENWRNPYKDVQYEAKRDLGQKFFFDPRLSKTRNLSCHSCHQLSLAGTDALTISIGFLGIRNPHKFNSPTVLNTALHKLFFWDGRSEDLENQAMISLMGLHEMAFDVPLAVKRFKQLPYYQAELKRLFGENFPDRLGSQKNIQRAFRSLHNITKAVAHYQRGLLTRSRFDAFMEGEDILTKREISGAKKFISLNCIKCHSGPALGGHKKARFPIYGLYPYANKVMYDNDEKLKIPSLRNVGLTSPYYHNGAVKSLEEAIALMGRLQLNKKLSNTEVSDIMAFLNSLSAQNLPLDQPKLPAERHRYDFKNY
tara:strand:- start:4533 stop:5603 length:1071 start_codon:yes stop_codon:yes gene_type:complete